MVFSFSKTVSFISKIMIIKQSIIMTTKNVINYCKKNAVFFLLLITEIIDTIASTTNMAQLSN